MATGKESSLENTNNKEIYETDALSALKDKLDETLEQVIALICVANSDDFRDFNEEVVHHYMQALQGKALSAKETWKQIKLELGKHSTINQSVR